MATGFGLAKAVSSMVETPVVPWAHDFVTDSVLKHATEKAMYTKARYNWGIIGDVTLLAERDVVRHIEMARQTVACTVESKVIIVEIDEEMHHYQRNIMYDIDDQPRVPCWQSQVSLGKGLFDTDCLLPIGHNVDFIHSDIKDVAPTIFMDVDLMGSIKTCGAILQRVLWKQRSKFPLGTPTKGFIFTLSLRGAGGLENNLAWVLRELIPITGSTCTLGARDIVTIHEDTRRSGNGWKGIGSNKYPIDQASNPEILHDVMLHTYSEGSGGMLTGIIIYS
jgi:hypothetical protein